MLEFNRVRNGEVRLSELVYGLAVDDLKRLTNEMVDTILDLISGCDDQDVTFEPQDPDAYDGAAASEEEVNMAWTLGHVIVHTTASSEEAAALAAELARGVPFHGRSRSEVPWRTVTTIGQCRRRLEESRRMRLGSLAMWPDTPHLALTYKPYEHSEPMNAVMRFVYGLMHEEAHLEHIKEIIRQSRQAALSQVD